MRPPAKVDGAINRLCRKESPTTDDGPIRLRGSFFHREERWAQLMSHKLYGRFVLDFW